jgi:CO/xanthine dehydrogenase FAD-binding subunit
MDMEQTIEFILSAQAKLEASVQKHDEQIGELRSSVATLSDLVGRLAQAEIRLVERMTSGIQEVVERMTSGFQEVKEIQANTEYKLNALIETVDKLIRKNGNGR